MKAIVRCRADTDGNIEIEISANALKTINKAATILNIIAAVGGERCNACKEVADAMIDAINAIGERADDDNIDEMPQQNADDDQEE